MAGLGEAWPGAARQGKEQFSGQSAAGRGMARPGGATQDKDKFLPVNGSQRKATPTK